MNKCQICIDEVGRIFVQIYENGGLIVKKEISFEDMKHGLLSAEVEDEKYVQIGTFPNGYYNGGISNNGKNFFCFITTPARRYPVKYHEERFLIPYPALVFEFCVKEKRLVKSCVYAVKDTKVNDNTELFYFPYANVYPNGEICWGENILPKINFFIELSLIIELFFGSPYNDDLFFMRETAKNGFQGMYPLLQEVSKKKNYPKRWLESHNKTLGDLVKKYINN